jgi:hypothetical protein
MGHLITNALARPFLHLSQHATMMESVYVDMVGTGAQFLDRQFGLSCHDAPACS